MKFTKYQLERNKLFERQYLSYGGFCGTCGEGVKPILNNDTEMFGECPFDGTHPVSDIANEETKSK